eukprot:TRINITY_DN3503_c0_g1_i1.p1 TRINITY_DN3503_c0_g1~~TRINITY_DN3503_c0_g1_i1.p1  ORF type:complete len:266 (+),score=67.06 TRINITY_DN3503_c0_g1_i1:167-964(+)
MTTSICLLPLNRLPPVCVVVGDPLRAKRISDLLTDSSLLAMNREYHTYVGKYDGVELAVMSHGIGAGGASCAFEELIQAGVTTIIRAGTAGSFDPRFREGALVIATGAVRDDGVSDGLVPLGYPAICHYEVVQALVNSVQLHPDVSSYGVGVVTTVGHFYDGPLGNKNKLWAASKVLAIEMEVAILLVIASLRGIRAGAVVNIDNYIFEREESEKYEPQREIVHQGTFRMIRVVLSAAAVLAKQDLERNEKKKLAKSESSSSVSS